MITRARACRPATPSSWSRRVRSQEERSAVRTASGQPRCARPSRPARERRSVARTQRSREERSCGWPPATDACWRGPRGPSDNHAMRRVVCGLVVLLWSGVASADSIEGPPACPPGSRGDSSHEGQWCEPWPCANDGECNGGRCVPWRVCTRVANVELGGLRPRPPPTVQRTQVVGTCDPARACTGTEEPPPPTVGSFEGAAPPTCSEGRYCVSVALPPFPARPRSAASPSAPPGGPSAPPSPTTTRNCGCSAVGAPSRGAFALALLLVLAWRRR